MNRLRIFVQNMKLKRLLLSQLLFTALAFLLMVILSYFFVRSIVHNDLTRYAESVFASAQTQVEYDLLDSENALGSYAQAIRSMLQDNTDIDMIRRFTFDMAEYLQVKKGNLANSENIVDDLFVYLETAPGKWEVISGVGWVFPEGQDPTERLWYQTAAAAAGDVAITQPFTSLMSGNTVVAFTKSVDDDSGERLAIVGLNVQIAEIGEKIVSIALDKDGYGMLFSQDLMIIAHANPDFLGMYITDPALPMTLFVEDILAGRDIAADTFVNWLGEETIAFVRQLPNGWYLGLLTPKGPFYKSLDDMILILSVLGAILAAILIIILIRIDSARGRASEESRQKSIFLANMSHEIRTPLNAVIGLSELVLEANEWNEENMFRLEQINSAGETLLSTVNDILDISKIEAGRFELIPTTYDIPSLINDAATQSILHRGEKQIEFKLNISEDLPSQLYGDELRIKQVLNNLLSNSFKYTMAGAVELTIKCEREGEAVWLIIIVRDTGIGIRKDNLSSLFSDYTQLDTAANRKIIGTGLGLSITKRLVDLMGGKITIDSEYGRGSVFSVSILQKHVTDEKIGHEIIESLKNFHYSEQKRRRLGSMARLSLPYARVLIVDDVVTNLDVAKGLMKPYNMRVDCLTSGLEAVQVMYDENIRYNAIFMDHMMPGMDGIEATRLIREIDTEYAKNIPIIALTANAIVGNEEMFLNKGFQAFISKPVEISRLDAVINEWVRDKEQEKMFSRPNEIEYDEQDESYNYRQLFKKSVSSFDFLKGIMLFGNDIKVYLGVLRTYARITPRLLEAAMSANTSLKEYETIVHGIKGSSRAILATEIGDKAEALENAARTGDQEYVDAWSASFAEDVQTLINDINEIINEVGADFIKPKREQPDRKTLEKLLEACKNYEMNQADAAISELEIFDYDSDGDLVDWLRDNIEQTNFEEIADRLSALLENQEP